MRILSYLILGFCFIISIVDSVNVSADGPYPGCLEKLAANPTVPDFRNFYHEYMDIHSLNNIFEMAYQDVCMFYVIGGSPIFGDIKLSQVIPVYFPKKDYPRFYQFVYTGQDYRNRNSFDLNIGTGLLWGISAFSDTQRTWSFPHFWAGAIADSRWQNSDAYLTSQKEPFKSAPMLQMYYYLGQPLLVARSSTGIVTDVFFQGRTVADPMERAKKYLGKKWYSP